MQELKLVLPILMRNNVVPFIWGTKGIGKTQGVKQLVTGDMEFVHLHLATQEVGDLVGLLKHNSDGTVSHSRPSWFPTSGRGIIFLDEMNRLSPDVMQCMFSFILDKTIHTHRLPDGWNIVAAGNYDNNNYQVTNLGDDAFMSRFCHIDFKPTKEEFINYMEAKDQDVIASFVRNQPEMLEVNKKEDKLDLMKIATPDRRKFDTMIAPLESESALDNTRYEVYSGIIGPSATAAFFVHKKKSEERLSGKQVLNKYGNVYAGLRTKVISASNKKESVRLDYLNGAVDEILSFVTNDGVTLKSDQINNLKLFLLDLPLELGLKFINGITQSKWIQKDEIINDITFIKSFKSNKLERSS